MTGRIIEFTNRLIEGIRIAARDLDFLKVFGHRAAVAVLNAKAHPIASSKLLEAGHVDG